MPLHAAKNRKLTLKSYVNAITIVLQFTQRPDREGGPQEMSAIARFSQDLARLLPSLGSGDFCPLLVSTIRRLVPVDEVSVIEYESDSMPIIAFADPDPAAQPNLDAFLKGAFLLDPYYVAATKHQKSGFFELLELAPTAFRQSEYFNIYYQHSELRDECGYLVPIKGGGFVNIELGQIGSSEFSQENLQILRDVSPLVEVLCDLHWRKKQRNDKRETRLRGQLESALANFGGSVLTKRECEVINLVLVGHSTKTLAEALDISPETVKLHRKHAYAKLDVKTQSELFYLFIDSLMSIKGYDAGDPLLIYLRKPLKV